MDEQSGSKIDELSEEDKRRIVWALVNPRPAFEWVHQSLDIGSTIARQIEQANSALVLDALDVRPGAPW